MSVTMKTEELSELEAALKAKETSIKELKKTSA
jgi:hypothetical protein